ncbi:MAG: S1 RNA-binding domain-containing protein [Clostridiales bacterium]
MLVEVGKIIEGKISGITKFGAFVEFSDGKTGLVHISEVAQEYVKDIKDHLKENEVVKVKVVSVNENGKISLSIKKAFSQKENYKTKRPAETKWNSKKVPFEEQLAKFLKDSDEKLHDLKKSCESKRGGGYKKTI